MIKNAIRNILILIVTLLFVEIGLAYVVPEQLPSVEFLRLKLVGDTKDTAVFQRSIALPYLLYGPAPHYKKKGHGRQHNFAGYRGQLVPLDRKADTIRILALGGSTTYGWKVRKPEQTWPAQLERLLKIDRPDGVKGIEVINGGLPLGSTAELVTHYLYKYRYYRPDIVIINTGGNDAYPRILDNFHPDYSHWKQPMNVPRPASNFGQILFSSRLAALLTIPIFYDIRSVDYTVKRVGSEPPVQWYDRGDREVGIAFRSNLETLVREIKADGAKVYLMPFRMRPKNAYPPELRVAILDNERILKQTATKFAVDIIPFPEEIISPMNWRDNCHLNAAGSLQKAQQISLKVRADVINFIR